MIFTEYYSPSVAGYWARAQMDLWETGLTAHDYFIRFFSWICMIKKLLGKRVYWCCINSKWWNWCNVHTNNRIKLWQLVKNNATLYQYKLIMWTYITEKSGFYVQKPTKCQYPQNGKLDMMWKKIMMDFGQRKNAPV